MIRTSGGFGCTADVRRMYLKMPYGHRTGTYADTVRAYGGCTARNRGWAWASRFECGVSRGATPLHTPCASSISPIMWMSRGCHTARFNNRGISYGYRTDIQISYGYRTNFVPSRWIWVSRFVCSAAGIGIFLKSEYSYKAVRVSNQHRANLVHSVPRSY